MKKILVLTKDNPIETLDIMRRFYSSFAELDSNVVVVSLQFTAWQVQDAAKKQGKEISYLDCFYSAVRTFKKINSFIKDDTNFLIVVGTVDKVDKYNYDAIIGINNGEIEDYPNYNEDTNTTNIKLLKLKDSDVSFNTIEEAIYFIRIIMERERREQRENELQ